MPQTVDKVKKIQLETRTNLCNQQNYLPPEKLSNRSVNQVIDLQATNKTFKNLLLNKNNLLIAKQFSIQHAYSIMT